RFSDFVIFFFSSRRRHTRFSRDWSSDVCSSDLPRRKGRGWWRRFGSHLHRSPPCKLLAAGKTQLHKECLFSLIFPPIFDKRFDVLFPESPQDANLDGANSAATTPFFNGFRRYLKPFRRFFRS